MSKAEWTPWHEVVELRDDLKSGELTLSMFAADLYDVAMGVAKPIYQDPAEFFALTYPTFNLRELVKDVLLRLAGKNDKAIRQLQLTYGGGKTHALITMYHLVCDPANLPEGAAVKEFIQHAGVKPPKARIAVLPFDRLDPVTGMDVLSPDGNKGRFKYPWTVMAFQLAGDEGLAILGMKNKTERETPPFTNVIEAILRFPSKDKFATLVLMDEVLMWARTKVGEDPVWGSRLQDFFQCLTQAATKVDRCAVVASLLATEVKKQDEIGKKILKELSDVFRREQEEGVEPVGKEDVAEVLRRRLFKARSIKDKEAFRPHVSAALKGIAALDPQVKKGLKEEESRFLNSYPFHPSLTDVFYAKWTELESFQRTRGVLRTFALALRDACRWDESPLVAANVFLAEPGKGEISPALDELAKIAELEEYEGRKQAWRAILQGELEKARAVQGEMPGLKHREVEQAVVAAFLHSQPVGQKARTAELMTLLGHSRPDKIELEKGLLGWADVSWFLDEAAINEAQKSGGTEKVLPKSWRLGSRPNLRQMHHDAVTNRVSQDAVEAMLLDQIGKNKLLTAGTQAAKVRVHLLPQKPKDIEDDGEFHFAILGPAFASEHNRPNPNARPFIDETTGPDRPRTYRNALVLAAPSREGLEVARDRIKDHLGWLEVQAQLKEALPAGAEIDPVRSAMLSGYIDQSRKAIPEAVAQAYCIVITVSEKNEIEAFRIPTGDDPLFTAIKANKRARIQDTPVEAEALLPGGPYDLWREGETSRRVSYLVGAFAQFPHLPKMLHRKAILDTLLDGCGRGNFVLRITRPDRSVRTFWRERPDENAIKEPSLEVVLPEAAELTSLRSDLLRPGVLPSLWDQDELPYPRLVEYFAGGHSVTVQRQGYEERVAIPKAGKDVIAAAVGEAVQKAYLWMVSGPASLWGESIPAGLLNNDAVLRAPPQPVPATDILPGSLPEAWGGKVTTALAILSALSKKEGKPLPWRVVRESVDGALKARYLELTEKSCPWPAESVSAGSVQLRLPQEAPSPPPPPPSPPRPGMLVAQAYLAPGQIQDLAEAIPAIAKASAGKNLKYMVRLELDGVTRDDPCVQNLNKELKGVSKDLQF